MFSLASLFVRSKSDLTLLLTPVLKTSLKSSLPSRQGFLGECLVQVATIFELANRHTYLGSGIRENRHSLSPLALQSISLPLTSLAISWESMPSRYLNVK